MTRVAGDFDYERNGQGYARQRRTDPRIAAVVHEALGPSRTVLNVGAGAGSYEPHDRHVVAVEPSAAMRIQRPPECVPAINAVAEHLPFDDRVFDASMAMVTVHQWPDLARGLAEMRRVTRGPVIVLTFEPEALGNLWLGEYGPELLSLERTRIPPIRTVCEGLGGDCEVRTIMVAADCVDGFAEAYYARPERFLDPAVRRAQSSWGFLQPGQEERIVARLAEDLRSGVWDERHGQLRTQPQWESSLRLVTSNMGTQSRATAQAT